MFGATQSGRIYINEGSAEIETSPLISPPRESEEELVKVSPRSANSMIRQQIPCIPPHHISSVACSAHFKASKRCYSCTSLSNFFRKSSTLLNPSYIGRSLTSVVTQRSDLIIMLQLSVVTSRNWFCHRSISLSKSEVKELLHSHEILPFAIGFTQPRS